MVIGAILVSHGSSGNVAKTEQRSKVYVTNSGGDDITIIDPVRLKSLGTLKVGKGPHGLISSAEGDRLYVTVEDSQKLLIIDTVNDQIIGEVTVGRIPNQPTLTRDGRFCYVPLRGDSAVEIVDLIAMKVVRRLPAPAWPHNMYTTQDGKRIYLGSIEGEKLTVIDPATETVIDETAMGAGVRPLAIQRRGTPVFAALSKLHGFVMFDPDQKKIIRRVELPALPSGTPAPFLNTYTHGLLLVDDDRELWVTSCPGNAVYVFAVSRLKQIGRTGSPRRIDPSWGIDVGAFPHWLSVTADGRVVFVSNMNSDTVTAIDARSKRVLATIPVGKAPKRLLVVTPRPRT